MLLVNCSAASGRIQHTTVLYRTGDSTGCRVASASPKQGGECCWHRHGGLLEPRTPACSLVLEGGKLVFSPGGFLPVAKGGVMWSQA